MMQRKQAAYTYLSQLLNAMIKMFNRRNGCLLIGLSIVILRMDGSVKSVNTMELMIDLPLLSHSCNWTLHSSDNSHQEPPNRCLVCRSKGWMNASTGPCQFRSIVDELLCQIVSFSIQRSKSSRFYQSWVFDSGNENRKSPGLTMS